MANRTAIEVIVEALRNAGIQASDVLVPEQCAMIYIGEYAVHVTATVQESVMQGREPCGGAISPNGTPNEYDNMCRGCNHLNIASAKECANCGRALQGKPEDHRLRMAEPEQFNETERREHALMQAQEEKPTGAFVECVAQCGARWVGDPMRECPTCSAQRVPEDDEEDLSASEPWPLTAGDIARVQSRTNYVFVSNDFGDIPAVMCSECGWDDLLAAIESCMAEGDLGPVKASQIRYAIHKGRAYSDAMLGLNTTEKITLQCSDYAFSFWVQWGDR